MGLIPPKGSLLGPPFAPPRPRRTGAALAVVGVAIGTPTQKMDGAEREEVMLKVILSRACVESGGCQSEERRDKREVRERRRGKNLPEENR